MRIYFVILKDSKAFRVHIHHRARIARLTLLITQVFARNFVRSCAPWNFSTFHKIYISGLSADMYWKASLTQRDLDAYARAVRRRAQTTNEDLTAFNAREEERRRIQARFWLLRYRELRAFALESEKLEKERPVGERFSVRGMGEASGEEMSGEVREELAERDGG